MMVYNDCFKYCSKAYGYLYGYPDYAVDFYTNTTRVLDSTRIIVNNANDTIKLPLYKPDRKPVKIPVYKQMRPKYVSEIGFDAISLIQDWFKKDDS
jgi:hypothetical protein